ncbi:MAG: hypothetical protein JM58_13315 [Peptococcaceae bacterium BICA1-8]|nr:MAG: hypothetical protein JM58_13315 [Peptococcaceae bacterium BICA1-8]
MKNLKINPLWIAIATVWVPGVIAKSPLPETPKTIMIWIIVIIQIYLLYIGIERLRAEKK